MFDANEDTVAPQNTLELQRCPECGYSLRTLPSAGRCPECGFDYDPSLFVLYGWGAGQRASVANASRGRLVWIMIATPIFFTVAFFDSVSALLRGRSRGGALFLFGMFAIWVWSFMRRRESIQIHGAPSSLRLSPCGFEQRDGSRVTSSGKWDERSELILKRKSGECYRIQVFTHRYRWWWIDEPAADFEASIPLAVMDAIELKAQMWCKIKQSRRG